MKAKVRGVGERDAMGKDYLLTLETVAVLRKSDELNYKNQRNKPDLSADLGLFSALKENPRSKCHHNTTLCC